MKIVHIFIDVERPSAETNLKVFVMQKHEEIFEIFLKEHKLFII